MAARLMYSEDLVGGWRSLLCSQRGLRNSEVPAKQEKTRDTLAEGGRMSVKTNTRERQKAGEKYMFVFLPVCFLMKIGRPVLEGC